MRKWKIILPNLIAITSLPLVSLVGCNKKPNQPVDSKPHVYFNKTAGGSFISGETDITVETNTRWCDLVADEKIPKVKVNEGYKFIGWFRYGNQLKDDNQTKIKSNFSVTAVFEPIPQQTYTITLDLWGGEIEGLSGNTIKVMGGTTYGELPKPTRLNYLFSKWIYKQSGQDIDPNTIIEGDVEIVARYTVNPAPDYLVVTGGHTTFSSNSWENGQDDLAWYLTDGQQQIQPDSFYLIKKGNLPIDGITINNERKVQWSKWLTPGTYTFSVEMVYKNWKIESNDLITLTITNCNFNTCDWSRISEVCSWLESGEIGEEEFCKCFTVNSQENAGQQFQAASFNDFIGQSRPVYVNNIEHKTIVVGVQQDYLDEDKPVALTWQFMNIITNSSKNMFAKWSTTSNTDYWNSTLVSELNSTTETVWYNGSDVDPTQTRSVYKMIADEADNNGLSECIRDVYHTVSTKTSTEWVADSQKTKLFCPTLSNIFSKTGLEKATDFIRSEDVDQYCQEGQQYLYYKNNGIGDSKASGQHSCLVLKNTYGEACDYLISSPCFHDLTFFETTRVWSIYREGNISTNNFGQAVRVAPCFCI
ncbi:MAG: InlB B-repeat-containing protein [Mycoplasmoidaceae bacterium]